MKDRLAIISLTLGIIAVIFSTIIVSLEVWLICSLVGLIIGIVAYKKKKTLSIVSIILNGIILARLLIILIAYYLMGYH